MKIYNIEERVTTLGPGERACIWLQGCNKNCKGCMSPASRGDGGRLILADDLFRLVKNIKGIEGITLSGGEVFLQIPELHAFLKRVREETNLGVIIYTGYYLDEIKQMKNPMVDEIIDKFSDIIVDGPYIEELNDGCALRGSSNQKVHFLTERYKKYADLYAAKGRKCEVRIKGRHAVMLGVPTREILKVWREPIA